MNATTELSRARVRRWLGLAQQELTEHAELLNALNVFPVADADTGTNLAATAATAAGGAALLESPDLGELLTLSGQAALDEARGNSGSLLAVWLTALGAGLEGRTQITDRVLARAMTSADVRTWSALSDPVPGTLLTVLRAAAGTEPSPETAEGSEQRRLLDYLHRMVHRAAEAVRGTAQELEALRGTRRVDAGALGMLIVLDALRRSVAAEAAPSTAPAWGEQTDPAQEADPAAGCAAGEGTDPELELILEAMAVELRTGAAAPSCRDGSADTGVEVVASVELSALDAASARHELAEVGESVIVSAVAETGEDRWRWRVHVHVPVQDLALDVLRRYGTPKQISVTGLGADPAREVRVNSADLT